MKGFSQLKSDEMPGGCMFAPWKFFCGKCEWEKGKKSLFDDYKSDTEPLNIERHSKQNEKYI